MRNIAVFELKKIKTGYSVFVFWEKVYNFPSLRLANKFIVGANNLLFTEFFKVNELFIDIFPDAQRMLFTAHPFDQNILSTKITEIQDMLRFCHRSKGKNENFPVYVISKLFQCYKELKEINELLLSYYKRSNNTVGVYKSKVYIERLEISQRDFTELKFTRLEKEILEIETPVIQLAVAK